MYLLTTKLGIEAVAHVGTVAGPVTPVINQN